MVCIKYHSGLRPLHWENVWLPWLELLYKYQLSLMVKLKIT